MISSGNGRRTCLRAMTVALLGLVVSLAAGSLAFARTGVDTNIVSRGGAKHVAIDELIRARVQQRHHHRHHRRSHRPKHARKHRATQPGLAPRHASESSSPSRTDQADDNAGAASRPTAGPKAPSKPTPPAPPATSPPTGSSAPEAPPAEPESPPAPPAPTPPPAACTTTVSTVAAAQAAVSGAAPGAVVCLADGSYGKVTLNASKSGAGVTLRAADPGAATIDGASLAGAGITLAYFDVTDEVEVQEGAKEITIQDNKITGGYFGIDACDSDSTTCDDVKIVGNLLQGPYGEDGIRANRYHDGDGDGLGLLVEGNEFTGIRENGNHSDCMQTVWTGDHLVFRKNYLHDNRCQGFFVKDQDDLCGAGSSGVCGPVEGIRVEDNLFLRNQEPCAATAPGCGQPVILHIFGPYTNAVIAHNTIWGDGMTSLIGLREGVAPGTRVEGNAIYRFWTDTDATPATLLDNTYCMLEGSWPTSRPGSAVECAPAFADPAADDYRLASGRGVDWAPAEEHYGP